MLTPLLLAGLAETAAPHKYPGGPAAPLPTGRLLLIGGNLQALNYIALDQSAKRGAAADVWMFRVFAQPVAGTGAVESFRHFEIDCAKRSFTELSEDAYDAQDRWMLGMPRQPTASIEASSTQDFLARVMCDGESPPQIVIVRGVREAREMARKVLAADVGSR